jgi:fido (protein-threonine AMPylation protein)
MSPSHGAPFRGFRDDNESPFFRALGHPSEETWELSVDRLAGILKTLDTLAASGPIEISTELLCSWHREIFGALFPEHAGRLRGLRHGRREHIYFDIRTSEYRGTNPRKLPRRLAKICTEFNTTSAAIRASPQTTDSFEAIHAATRLYAKVLRAHPFLDGNLRATIVALNAALLTLGLPQVQFKDLELHDELLSIAFAGKHDPYRPLAEYIAEISAPRDTPDPHDQRSDVIRPSWPSTLLAAASPASTEPAYPRSRRFV